MDTSDPLISFDEHGISNHYYDFKKRLNVSWFPNEAGLTHLKNISEKVRLKSKKESNEYDIIIGLSGGVDSSYLAFYVKEELGLNPLAVHIDAGWNSELATQNIEDIVKALGIDLVTYVVNWEEMRDLQLAYFKAGVLNQDVPQDHVFMASLYKTAREYNIKYFFSGHNYATESCLPSSWTTRAQDLVNLKDIHQKFGTIKLKSIPLSGFYKTNIFYPYIYGLKIVFPLNYLPYKKSEALSFLESRFKWRYYGGKHYESRFTKFFQSYYLIKKFGIDKRKAHLSSLILNGEITREEAIDQLKLMPFSEFEVERDIEYISKKLKISITELKFILDSKPVSHNFYKSDQSLYKLVYNTIKKSGLYKILYRP
jgi:N-acetyl sugar amidotransferase